MKGDYFHRLFPACWRDRERSIFPYTGWLKPEKGVYSSRRAPGQRRKTIFLNELVGESEKSVDYHRRDRGQRRELVFIDELEAKDRSLNP